MIRYVRGVVIKEAVKCTVNYAAPNDCKREREREREKFAGSLWSLTKSRQNVQVSRCEKARGSEDYRVWNTRIELRSPKSATSRAPFSFHTKMHSERMA